MNAILDRVVEAEPPFEGRPWAQTRSGRAFPLVRPEPSDVHWPDIAFALAHNNRFAGHVGNYSVAQHSILVMSMMPEGLELYGLLHDAHEAYIGDITTPAARAIVWHAREWAGADADVGESCAHAGIQLLKSGIDRAIYGAAGLPYPIPQEALDAVHVADKRAMMTEHRDLMRPAPYAWGFEQYTRYRKRVFPWQSSGYAKTMFVGALRKCGISLRSAV